MNKKLKTIEITLEDIELIMGERFSMFPDILENCFCVKCKDYITTIVNYKAFLNPLQDVELGGTCIKCGHAVGRYIETGEIEESVKAAKHIRRIKKSGF